MKVGVIGYGERSAHVTNHILGYDMGVEFSAVADVNQEQVRKRMSDNGFDYKNTKFYNDADEMLDKEKLDGVIVGTRCSLHTQMAVRVLKRNINLYLEKPVATNMDDLLILKEAYERSKSGVVVSFPLRATAHVKLAKEIIQSGKLGTIEHVQAINNVPYGYGYFQSWYRDENETGGLFLQKATHDLDYINYLLDIRPINLCAMKSKQIFKGSKQEGLMCKECAEKNTCPEGPLEKKYHKMEDFNEKSMCSFAKDTGNEDSGSVLIRYETGMHVSYSQNFFARKAAAYRGARLLGYKGTLEFDWYTDELKVLMHDSPRVETYKFDSSNMAHGGGDHVLALSFINIMQGSKEAVAPMEAGLLSALMCLKAKQSSETGAFQEISWNK